MEHAAQQDGRWAAPAATGPVRARLAIPGSKSMTNRALVLAALAATIFAAAILVALETFRTGAFFATTAVLFAAAAFLAALVGVDAFTA